MTGNHRRPHKSSSGGHDNRRNDAHANDRDYDSYSALRYNSNYATGRNRRDTRDNDRPRQDYAGAYNGHYRGNGHYSTDPSAGRYGGFYMRGDNPPHTYGRDDDRGDYPRSGR